jgi:hypothetical protein
VTAGSNIAVTGAAGRRGGINGGKPTGDTSKALKAGSTTATVNAPTGIVGAKPA